MVHELANWKNQQFRKIGRQSLFQSTLAWRFRELCDEYGGWPVFYQVQTDHLHIYLDLGLTLVKLGEEACVELSSFSLEGGGKKGLRRVQHRLQQEGCHFEIIPKERVGSLMADTLGPPWTNA
jgi:phosphatidylglycerol lysyltransferase